MKPSAPVILQQSGALICNSGEVWSFEIQLVEFDTVYTDILATIKREGITENMAFFDFGTTSVSDDGIMDNNLEIGYIIYHKCKKHYHEVWSVDTITAPLSPPKTYNNFFVINLLDHWAYEE